MQLQKHCSKEHKTAECGKDNAVPIVCDAKEALADYMNRAPQTCCFSPKEAMVWFRATQHANRETKAQRTQQRWRLARANPNTLVPNMAKRIDAPRPLVTKLGSKREKQRRTRWSSHCNKILRTITPNRVRANTRTTTTRPPIARHPKVPFHVKYIDSLMRPHTIWRTFNEQPRALSLQTLAPVTDSKSVRRHRRWQPHNHCLRSVPRLRQISRFTDMPWRPSVRDYGVTA